MLPCALSLAVTTVAGCTHKAPSAGPAPAARHASITASPRTALIDVPVTVTVTGLSPGQQVTLQSSAVDAEGAQWQASARFRVPAGGVVTTDQASLGGSYAGVDPMGLFDLMAPPADEPSTSVDVAEGETGYSVSLSASVAGTQVATGTARRNNPGAVNLRTRELTLKNTGVYGEVFLPPGHPTPRPAVVIVGGSQGGLGDWVTETAQLIAAHGYPALALAYFDEPGLPHGLKDVPLEYFVNAVKILRAQPGVDPQHVLVYGDSRGSEVALLLGADFPNLVNGVIAGSPSSVAHGSYPTAGSPAWTLHGRTVAYWYGFPTDGTNNTGAIAVEEIRGPILLACGGLDDIWPSCQYQNLIAKRLRAHDFRYPVTTLSYPQAGHYVGGMQAYLPVAAAYYTGSGGTLVANQRAEPRRLTGGNRRGPRPVRDGRSGLPGHGEAKLAVTVGGRVERLVVEQLRGLRLQEHPGAAVVDDLVVLSRGRGQCEGEAAGGRVVRDT